jgi:DNA helicase TIP49 (TBP-interacting protein)
LTPANVLTQTNGREVIEKGDLEEVSTLFLDAKMSAKVLLEHAVSGKYIV